MQLKKATTDRKSTALKIYNSVYNEIEGLVRVGEFIILCNEIKSILTVS